MSSKKTTTTFKSNLSKLGGGPASGVKRENLLQGFTPSSPINFGNPSDRKALISSAGTGMDWGGLAKQVVSGGAASLFNASSAVGLGGLGSLISGITSLFGGGEKKAPPRPSTLSTAGCSKSNRSCPGGLGRLGGSRARSSDGHAIVCKQVKRYRACRKNGDAELAFPKRCGFGAVDDYVPSAFDRSGGSISAFARHQL